MKNEAEYTCCLLLYNANLKGDVLFSGSLLAGLLLITLDVIMTCCILIGVSLPSPLC